MQGGIVLLGAAVAAAALGWVLFLWSYAVLRLWVRQCRGARLAVYYNRHPVLDFSLEEYLRFANLLDKDTESKGRVMYTGGKMRVVLIRRGVR